MNEELNNPSNAPTPEIFAERLNRLRERGLLGNPKFQEAFLAAADKVKAEQQEKTEPES